MLGHSLKASQFLQRHSRSSVEKYHEAKNEVFCTFGKKEPVKNVCPLFCLLNTTIYPQAGLKIT